MIASLLVVFVILLFVLRGKEAYITVKGKQPDKQTHKPQAIQNSGILLTVWICCAMLGGLSIILATTHAEVWYREAPTQSNMWLGISFYASGILCVWCSIVSERKLLERRILLPAVLSSLLICTYSACTLFGNTLIDTPSCREDSTTGLYCIIAGFITFLIWFILGSFKRK